MPLKASENRGADKRSEDGESEETSTCATSRCGPEENAATPQRATAWADITSDDEGDELWIPEATEENKSGDAWETVGQRKKSSHQDKSRSDAKASRAISKPEARAEGRASAANAPWAQGRKAREEWKPREEEARKSRDDWKPRQSQQSPREEDTRKSRDDWKPRYPPQSPRGDESRKARDSWQPRHSPREQVCESKWAESSWWQDQQSSWQSSRQAPSDGAAARTNDARWGKMSPRTSAKTSAANAPKPRGDTREGQPRRDRGPQQWRSEKSRGPDVEDWMAKRMAAT